MISFKIELIEHGEKDKAYNPSKEVPEGFFRVRIIIYENDNEKIREICEREYINKTSRKIAVANLIGISNAFN